MRLQDYTQFQGPEIKDGKEHFINRRTCSKCGEVLSEMHYGCCGYMAKGWSKEYHECKGRGMSDHVKELAVLALIAVTGISWLVLYMTELGAK